MRFLLSYVLLLVFLVNLTSAAPANFGRLAKRGHDSVDLDVKRILRSRQLTREQLVTRAREKATRTRPQRRTSPGTPHPFKLVDSLGNNYDLSNGAVHAYKNNGSPQYFTLSGPSPNTVKAVGGSGVLGFSASANVPTVLNIGGTNSITCAVDTTTSSHGSVPFSCVVTATSAPVIFCRSSGPNLYASASGSCGSYTQVGVTAVW